MSVPKWLGITALALVLGGGLYVVLREGKPIPPTLHPPAPGPATPPPPAPDPVTTSTPDPTTPPSPALVSANNEFGLRTRRCKW